MNFTNKKDNVRRTVLKKIKNSNVRHRMENKKTTVLFSFNPKTKIGILSAEIEPSLKETVEHAEINKKPPALPIYESKIIASLQEVVSTYKTPVTEVTDKLVMYVTNSYLKNIDGPYSFIDSKRIKRIIEKHLKIKKTTKNNSRNNQLFEEHAKEINWLKKEVQMKSSGVNEKQIQSLVDSIIEKKYGNFKKHFQDIAKQHPGIDEEKIKTLIHGIQKNNVEYFQKQIQEVSKQIPNIDEKKVKTIVQSLHEENNRNIQKQIQEVSKKIPTIDEAKISKMIDVLQKESNSSFQKQIQEVSKKVPDIDEAKVKSIVQGIQQQNNESFHNQLKELSDKIPNLDEEKVKNIVTGLQEENNKNIQKQIEDVTKMIPDINESKIHTIVQAIQKDSFDEMRAQMEELKSSVSKVHKTEEQLEKQIETYLLNALNADNENKEGNPKLIENNLEIIIERVVKRIIDRENGSDISVDPSADDISVGFDEVYGKENDLNSNFKSNDNPIISYIMNENIKDYPSNDNDMDVGGMDDVYSKSSGDKVLHVNELRTSLDKKWIPFGKGVKDTVMDMYVDPDTKKLYITGLFEQVDNVPASNIASYDISEKKWYNLGNGINNLGVCLTMDIENQILYIGGIFNSVDAEPNVKTANNIVSYNLYTNEWETLGEGFNGECACLCFDPTQQKLFAGGSFTKIGTEDISYIAFYDNVQKKWFPISDDVLNGPCRTMCFDIETSELYLGGVFTEVGDYMYYYVASFNTKSKEWTELSGGLQGHCNCVCYNHDKKLLYVGGTFNSVGSEENRVEAHHIASYHVENHEWSPLGEGLDGVCHSMLYNPEQKCLVVGGAFTHTVEKKEVVNHIVKYDIENEKWLPLENFFDKNNAQKGDYVGLDGNCKSLCMDDNAYYMCGTFKKAGTIHANSVVKYLKHKARKGN